MRSWKFWAFAAAVAVVWWVLQTIVPDRRLDSLILFGIGQALVFGAGGMMLVRRDWTARALGIFGVFLGTGLLYLGFGVLRVGWREMLGRTELNVIRAFLAVGVVLFDFGFVRWVSSYWRGSRVNEQRIDA